MAFIPIQLTIPVLIHARLVLQSLLVIILVIHVTIHVKHAVDYFRQTAYLAILLVHIAIVFPITPSLNAW